MWQGTTGRRAEGRRLGERRRKLCGLVMSLRTVLGIGLQLTESSIVLSRGGRVQNSDRFSERPRAFGHGLN